LRPDKVQNDEDRKVVMKNAAKKDDDYFVAPPGNYIIYNLYYLKFTEIFKFTVYVHERCANEAY
jgi:hypothetical protein